MLEGTDDWTLNRAVGHIADTAAPGQDGNSGIAGHRDGFFRGLKDIQTGDEMSLETPRGQEMYRIERTWIVDPTDVSVLDPRRLARSRWSPAIRSTSSAPHRSASSSARL